jgi:thioredoxin-related protein
MSRLKNGLFLALAITISMPAIADLKLGAKIPEGMTKMKNTDGRDVTIDELRKDKKGTLIVFSCNTCPYAKAWKERIVEIGKDATKKGMAVVMINSNDSSKNEKDGIEFMKLEMIPFPYVVDGTSSVAKAFGAEKTPDVFLFDNGGKLIYKGAIDDNADDANAVKKPYLKNAINKYFAGEKITEAETKSVGCGIKFRKS